MKRGDIYLVPLDPTVERERSGSRPVLAVSSAEFNEVTKLPMILPITNGGEFVRHLDFAVPVTNIKTTGVVCRDQPGVIDLAVHHARKVNTLLTPLMNEMLAKVTTLFEWARHEHEGISSTNDGDGSADATTRRRRRQRCPCRHQSHDGVCARLASNLG